MDETIDPMRATRRTLWLLVAANAERPAAIVIAHPLNKKGTVRHPRDHALDELEVLELGVQRTGIRTGRSTRRRVATHMCHQLSHRHDKQSFVPCLMHGLPARIAARSTSYPSLRASHE